MFAQLVIKEFGLCSIYLFSLKGQPLTKIKGKTFCLLSCAIKDLEDKVYFVMVKSSDGKKWKLQTEL